MKATTDLREEHRAVGLMLTILDNIALRMGSGQAPPAEDLQAVVEFLTGFVDRCHHHKEEELLFPALRERADVSTRQLIDRLLEEHAEGRAHVAVLSASTGFLPAAEPAQGSRTCRPGEEVEYAINGYVALLRPHLAAEEESLFPVADHVLPDEVQEELQAGYDRVEAEIIGPGRHEALHALLHVLRERWAAPP